MKPAPPGVPVGRTRSRSTNSSMRASVASPAILAAAATTSGSNGSPATAAPSSATRAASGSDASSRAVAALTADGTRASLRRRGTRVAAFGGSGVDTSLF